MSRPGLMGCLCAALAIVGVPAQAAPPPDALTTISIRSFDRLSVEPIAKRFAAGKKELVADDVMVGYFAVRLVRFGEASPDRSACRDLVARRAASLGIAPEEFLRRSLAPMPSLAFDPSSPEIDPDVRDQRKGFIGILAHHLKNPAAAETMGRDLWHGLSGEKVDISGRLGVDDRDLELEVDTDPYIPLYLDAFVNALSQARDAIPGFGLAYDWLVDKSVVSTTHWMVVKDPAARDAYALWLFLGWEKYWEKPDVALHKERPIVLSTFVLAARMDMPTVLNSSTRDRLGIAPGRWESFLRFVKESRSGSIAQRNGWTRLPDR